MKREFKVGDSVEITENFAGITSCHSAIKGDKKLIKSIDNSIGILYFEDGTRAVKERCKHLKPKEKQSDKIRRIVREEMAKHTPTFSALKALSELENSPEPQQPKSGWYKSPSWRDYLFYFDFEECTSYGIGILNYWEDLKDMNYFEDTDIPATNEEVITRLVDYIKSKQI